MDKKTYLKPCVEVVEIESNKNFAFLSGNVNEIEEAAYTTTYDAEWTGVWK